MFNVFKKKQKREETTQYSLVIITEKLMEDSVYDEVLNRFDDHVGNIGFSGNLTRGVDRSVYIQKIEDHINITAYPEPFFVIVRIDFEEIKEKEKALEKKHKWKKFFDTIPLTEYITIYDEVHTKPENIVFHTGDMDEAIAFLKEQEHTLDN
ncbi:hypothetical protein RYX56_00715 [Alkalihalophilus lindianensis]|uniref:Uncharacterized protein n=1 Tax=Alkalihalophilus lindianensis TaxID=1630542 RepID=A0ABU3X4R6_9BACI|nr:hypothetical protein [Alkalihalophilus lindianensis]MDV2682886.1 hypothetical protein [Alkalihalophilus lindianensis]